MRYSTTISPEGIAVTVTNIEIDENIIAVGFMLYSQKEMQFIVKKRPAGTIFEFENIWDGFLFTKYLETIS